MKYVEVGGARMSAIGLGTWQFGSTRVGVRVRLRRARALTPSCSGRSTSGSRSSTRPRSTASAVRSGSWAGPSRDRRDEAFLASKIFPVLPIGPVVDCSGPGAASGGWASTPSTCTSSTSPTRWCRCRRPCPPSRELLDEGAVAPRRGVRTTRWPGGRRPRRPWGGPCCRTRSVTTWSTAAPRRSCCRGRRPTTGWSSPTARWPRACCRRATTPSTGPRASCGRLARVPSREPAPGRSRCSRCCGRWPSAHGATPSQVALAWLIRRPNVVVIPGASSVAQVEVNAAAADLELTDDEDAALWPRRTPSIPLASARCCPSWSAERPSCACISSMARGGGSGRLGGSGSGSTP